MVDKKDIELILNNIINNNSLKDLDLKCTTTVGEMHTILDSLNSNVKDYLVKTSLTEKQYDDYQKRLNDDDEEGVFEYERKIFEKYTPSVMDKILNNNELLGNVDLNSLTDSQAETLLTFDKKDYPNDNTKYSMTSASPPGELEQAQLDYEFKKHSNFSEEIDSAVFTWTHGGYRSVQEIRLGSFDEAGNRYVRGDSFVDDCISANKYLEQGIKSSQGLLANNMVYRVGHWDVGLKAGDVSEFPCFTSTSYSAGAANSIGDGYAMHVYAPKKTKGMMIDTDYFMSDNFPEHEFLLGPGQKYLVLNVNDKYKTAEILLL